MIDEAHERSLNLDICLGILKEIQKISKQLKIIIMSATLEVTSFLAYFSDCYFIKIPGRIHSVSIKVKFFLEVVKKCRKKLF
jgi:HrpA-like RNA helicase